VQLDSDADAHVPPIGTSIAGTQLLDSAMGERSPAIRQLVATVTAPPPPAVLPLPPVQLAVAEQDTSGTAIPKRRSERLAQKPACSAKPSERARDNKLKKLGLLDIELMDCATEKKRKQLLRTGLGQPGTSWSPRLYALSLLCCFLESMLVFINKVSGLQGGKVGGLLEVFALFTPRFVMESDVPYVHDAHTKHKCLTAGMANGQNSKGAIVRSYE
jgi:hypothetical protein